MNHSQSNVGKIIGAGLAGTAFGIMCAVGFVMRSYMAADGIESPGHEAVSYVLNLAGAVGTFAVGRKLDAVKTAFVTAATAAALTGATLHSPELTPAENLTISAKTLGL